ncbi:MAG: hypothetical protein JSV56_03805 [Methanomassiliicoccales archaeon]|nr:MAG: hypothetical protein JSV56_03805 [Methanomassiliicoccales archaeon]
MEEDKKLGIKIKKNGKWIDPVDKEQNLRSGNWCLKYGMWVDDCWEDRLCVAIGLPTCVDCPWAAWNVTWLGRPLDDMPKPIYWGWKWSENEEIGYCEHDSMFLHWSGYPEKPGGEWIKIDVETNCDCKSPKRNPQEKKESQILTNCEEGEDGEHDYFT